MVLDQQVTGRHVVVLGGGGFIGSNLCNRLYALGAHVTAVDTVFPSWRRPDVMCRRADLTSLAETVRAIVGAGNARTASQRSRRPEMNFSADGWSSVAISLMSAPPIMLFSP